MAKPTVFISYCREDKVKARAFCARLSALGVDVWFDEEKLELGQNWRYEVSKAIRTSDYFLALISKQSLVKRGHVQRELKQACDIQDSLPEGKAFIIPCKLEECELPFALADLHWIESFWDFEGANRRIAKAVGAKQMIAEPAASAPSRGDKKRPVRRTVTLPPDFARRIEELRRSFGDTSDAETIRRALSILAATIEGNSFMPGDGISRAHDFLGRDHFILAV